MQRRKARGDLGYHGSDVSSNHGNSKCIWSIHGASIEAKANRLRTINGLNLGYHGLWCRLQLGRLVPLLDAMVGPFMSENELNSLRTTFLNNFGNRANESFSVLGLSARLR